MKKITIITVCTLGLFLSNLIGQNNLEKVEKVFQKYQQMEVVSMDIEAYSYVDRSDKKGEKMMSGAMRLNKDKYYSRMDDIEMIVVGEKMTVVDHQEKTISLGRSKSIHALKKEQPIFSMDSILAFGADVKYVRNINGQEVYSIEIPNSIIKQIEFQVNANGLITKMAYYYLSVPELESAYYKMEVLFKNINLKPPSEGYFDDGKYIADRNSKTPTSAYRGYSVEEVDYSNNFQD